MTIKLERIASILGNGSSCPTEKISFNSQEKHVITVQNIVVIIYHVASFRKKVTKKDLKSFSVNHEDPNLSAPKSKPARLH
jgi:hypothetical protein